MLVQAAYFWRSMHFAHPLMHSVPPKGSAQAYS